MFLGISLLGAALHVVPHEQETVLSQIARAVFGGRNVAYFVVQIATMLILVLAANTSYADFPRLASILARDRFAPTQFTHRGDRLAFSNGIIVLTLFAIALVVIFRGNLSPDSAVCRRRLPVVHALTGRHGDALETAS